MIDRGRPRRRGGTTLVEVVTALLLTTAILHLSVDALSRLKAGARRHEERRMRLDARRMTTRILRAELSGGLPGLDWEAYPPDSVRLRAYRVTAEVCAPVVDSALAVRPWGGRQVDPDKDSVAVLDLGGRWHVRDVVSRVADPTACAGGGEVWRLGDTTPQGVLARAFESGSYHLGPAELRYRRGGSGRQPLTGAGLLGFTLAGAHDSVDLIGPDGAPRTRLGRR